MSGLGRAASLKKGASVMAGVRVKNLDWGGESVDLTSGEDSGKQLLLAASGQEQVEIAVEGVIKDAVLREIALTSSSKMLTDVTLEFVIITPTNTTPAEISGDFRLSAYSEGMTYNDAITFSATLQSSGAWTYTVEAL